MCHIRHYGGKIGKLLRFGKDRHFQHYRDWVRMVHNHIPCTPVSVTADVTSWGITILKIITDSRISQSHTWWLECGATWWHNPQPEKGPHLTCSDAISYLPSSVCHLPTILPYSRWMGNNRALAYSGYGIFYAAWGWLSMLSTLLSWCFEALLGRGWVFVYLFCCCYCCF